MAKITSNKLSKALSMLLVISMVLSSVVFTLPVTAEETIYWEEDFSTLPTGTTNGTSFGVLSDAVTGWQFEMGGGATNFTANNYFMFDGGVLNLVRDQAASGDLSASNSFADVDVPQTGVIAVEFDYILDSPLPSSYGTKPMFAIKNTAGEYMFGMSIANATYGVVDSTKSTTGVDVSMSKEPDTRYFRKTVAGVETMLTGSEFTNNFANGTKSRISVTFDLDNETYSAKITTSNGNVYYTGNRATPFVSGLTNKKIGEIALQSMSWNVSDPKTGTVTSKFDNIVVKEGHIIPTVTSIVPANNATAVAVDSDVVITFSSPMNTESLENITLKNGDTTIACEKTFSNGNKTVTLNPTALQGYKTYTVNIPATVLSSSGGAMEPVTYSFRTILGDVTEKTVLWSENFDGLSAPRSGWTTTIYENGVGVSNWADISASTGNNHMIFDGSKLVMKKQQAFTGTDLVRVQIPITNIELPTTGYVAVEFDYTQDIEWVEKYQADTYIKDVSKANINKFTFGSSYFGLDDITSLGDGARDKILTRDTSVYVGNTVRVQVMYDVANSKYTMFYTKADGTKYQSAAGWQNLEGNKAFSLGEIFLQQSCSNKTGGVVTISYDNMAVVAYPQPDVVSTTLSEDNTQSTTDSFALTFDEEMLPATMANITLTPAEGNAVALTPTMSNGNKTVTLTHAVLQKDTSYTLTVPVTVLGASGAPIKQAKTYTFTTFETVIPTVASIVPANNATAVAVDSDVVITFSCPMNTASLSNILLKNGETIIECERTFSNENKTVTLSPTALQGHKTYTVEIPATVLSSTRGAIVPVSYSFKTGLGPITEKTVLWSENFDGLSAPRSGWGTAVMEDNVSIGDWAAISASTGDNHIIFDGSKLVIKKQQEFTGSNDLVRVQIPITNIELPTTGYVAVEFDYTQDIEWGSKYDADTYIRDASKANINKFTFGGGYYGLDDTTNAGDGDITKRLTNDKSVYVGNTVRVQVMYDIANSKYTMFYTKADGTKYQYAAGWQNLQGNKTFNGLGEIFLQQKCTNKAGLGVVTLSYDNMAVVAYPQPQVVSTTVPEGDNASITDGFAITFDEAMLPATMSKITLTPAVGNAIALTPAMSNENKTVTFTHAGLQNATTYTLTVPVTVFGASGTPIKEAKTYTFTTVGVAPTVVSTTPVQGTTNVAINSDITVTFDKAIKEDTISGVKLFDGATEITEVTRSLSADGLTVTINPSTDLSSGKTYTIKVTTAVKSTDNGVIAEEVTRTFTTVEAVIPTVTSIVPANNAKAVAVDSDVVITFSCPMNTSSLANILLKNGDTIIECERTFSNSNKTVTLNPTSLQNYKTYTVEIPATVLSSTGGAIVPISYSFRTVLGAITEKTILWSENFDGLSAPKSDWSPAMFEDDVSISGWAAVSASTGDNHIIFDGQKLVMKKQQEFTGSNDLVKIAIPFTNMELPTTGYVAVEFDYTQDIEWVSKYEPDTYIKDGSNANINRFTFGGGSYGLDDTTNISAGLADKRLTADKSVYVGNTVRVQVMYDIANSKYIMYYTKADGTKYQSAAGWQNLQDNKTFGLGQIFLQQKCTKTAGAGVVTISYDNMAVVAYTQPDVVSTTVPEGNNASITDSFALTFDEAMLPATMSNITLTPAAGDAVVLTPAMSNENKTVTLTHAGLKNSTTYTLTVPVTVFGASGTPIKEAKTYTFTTGAAVVIGPKVSSYKGFTNGGTAPIGQAIQLVFDKAMNAESLANITLVKKSDGTAVALTTALSTDSKTVTLYHRSLDYSTEYELTVPTTVKSAADEFVTTEIKYTFTTKAFKQVLWSDSFDTPWNTRELNAPFSGAYGNDWEVYIGGSTNDSKFDADDNAFVITDKGLNFIKSQGAFKGGNLLAMKSLYDSPDTGLLTLDFDFTMDAPYQSYAYFPIVSVCNTKSEQMLSLNFGSTYYGIFVNPAKDSGVYSTTQAFASEKNEYAFVRNNADKMAAICDGDLIHVSIFMDLDSKTYTVKLTTDGQDYYTPTAKFTFDPDLSNLQIGKVILCAQESVQTAYETPVTTTFDNIVLAIPEAVVPTIVSRDVTHSIVKAPSFTFDTPINEASLAGITLTKGGEAVAFTPTLSTDGKTLTITHAQNFAYGSEYVLTLPNTLKSSTNGAFAGEVITITTIEEAPTKVGTIWSNNFDSYDANTTTPTGWTAYVWVDNTTTANYADRTKYDNKYDFVDGKLVMTKQQNEFVTPDKIIVKMPFKDLPTITSDLVSLEFDVKQNINFVGDKWQDTIYIQNSEGKNITKLALNNASRGFQDTTNGQNVNYTHNSIAPATDYIGKNMHVEVLYDLKNSKYTIFYTVDGVRKMAAEGVQNMTADTFNLSALQFVIDCQQVAGSDPVVIEVDNMAVVAYATPATVTSNVTGSTNVATDGAISLTFSEAMKAEDMSYVTLKTAAGEAVTLTPSTSDNLTYTFAHAALTAATDYSLVIPTGLSTASGKVVNGATFAFKTAAAVAPEESIPYEYKVVSKSGDNFNKGDTITVAIVATAETEANVGSLFFDLDWDTNKLQLNNITQSISGSVQSNITTGKFAFTGDPSSPTIVNSTGVEIATATFVAKHDITGTALIDLVDSELTPVDWDINKGKATLTDLSVNLYNIMVTFTQGEGTTVTGAPVIAYAKYNETGLYADTTYTAESFTIPSAVANENYVLTAPAKYWKNGDSYYEASEIAAMKFTTNTSYEATADRAYKITLDQGLGTFTDASNQGKVLTPKSGTTFDQIGLPTSSEITAPKGTTFNGWLIDGVTYAEGVLNGVTVAKDLTVVAQFINNSYNFAKVQNDSVITVESGVTTEDKATHGTDIVFTVATTGNYVVTGVTYKIGDEIAKTIAIEDGKYKVPGDAITGDVTIEVATKQFHTVTFVEGAGTTLTGSTTAYVVDGGSKLYTTLDELKGLGEATFTIPTIAINDGYRFADSDILWVVSEQYKTNEAIAQMIFTADTTITSYAVKTQVVTFAVGANGTFEGGSILDVTKTFDKGYTLLSKDIPVVVAKDGYKFKEWQVSGVTEDPTGAVIDGDVTYTAVFVEDSYAVTFSEVTGITVTNITGLTDGKAVYGNDVTFKLTVDDALATLSAVKYKVNGNDSVTITPDGTGVYTIPGSAVIANITVLFETTGKSEVTFVAENGTVDVNTLYIVTNGQISDAELATINPQPTNEYYKFDGWYKDGVEVSDITDVIIEGATTFTAKFSLIERTVTADGLTIEYQDGFNNPVYGSALKFTIAKANNVILNVYYAVGSGERVLLSPNHETGVYEIEGNAITGDITITVDSVEGSFEIITPSDYMYGSGLILGRKMLLFKTDKVEGGKYTLATADMYYSSKYAGYVAWVDDEFSADAKIISTNIAKDTLVPAIEISYSGNINGANGVTAADAGIINDSLLNVRIGETTDLMLFELDFDGNKAVTTLDIVEVIKLAVQ